MKRRLGLCLCGALLWGALGVRAEEPVAPALRLARVFSDHMVVQRDQAVRLWGWAHPGAQVVVEFKGQSLTNRADWHGRWSAVLAASPASAEPTELVVRAGPEVVKLTDVLVGEVWLASGQSNMFWPVSNAKDAGPEIAAADYPGLRLFTVRTFSSPEPLDDLDPGRYVPWTVCRPDSVRGFSAVAYYFAREIHRTLKVPVGIMVSSWGDTCVESWTPLDVLQAEPLVAKYLQSVLDQGIGYTTNYARYLVEREAYEAAKQAAAGQGMEFRQPMPRAPMGPGDHNWPGGLWNAMIHPLCGYSVRGAIWYQGEANVWRAQAYQTLFPTMIRTWRERWGQGDFAFYWVQLANYKQPLKEPSATLWAELRQAQTATLAMPNTAQALAIDLADADQPNNIHPANKQEVGRRLALLARKNLYGEADLVAQGPTCRGHEILGNKVILHFDAHDEGGLMTRDGGTAVTGFAVAGADKKWFWATAELDAAGSITVSAPQVLAPVAVRYAFEDNPPVNLYNRAGLPATPFRTDDWGWLSQGR